MTAGMAGAARAGSDRRRFAVMVMVATDLTLASADAIIKATLSSVPLWQFIFLRSCLTIPLLILILKSFYPAQPLWPRRPFWASLRSALLLVSLLLYYAALPRLDLSLAAAVYYTIPLFITLFSAVLIREAPGIAGWTGVGLGFGGVLLMLRPDSSGISLFALMPLASAILYALAMVVTRTRARDENPFLLALIFNLLALILSAGAGLYALSGGPGAGTGAAAPVAMELQHWLLIGLLSATMLVGSVGTAIAYQSGPPSVIATWDFSYLVFAVLLGILFFAERLTLTGFLGIGLIIAAGVIVIRR